MVNQWINYKTLENLLHRSRENLVNYLGTAIVIHPTLYSVHFNIIFIPI